METLSGTYHIAHLKKADIATGQLKLQTILDGGLNGFVISDFLTSNEVSVILKGFRALTDPELIHINSGFNSYPISFAQFEQLLSQKKISEADYFNSSTTYINSFSEKFGVDIFSRLHELFVTLSEKTALHIPSNKENTGKYTPFTFRELFAGQGCLKAHCENLFLHEFPGFFNRINEFSIPENQLSFFIVLQAPGKGGELTLFDILWNENQKRPNDDEIILENGQKIPFDDTQNLHRDYIAATSGSLVIFTGGKIWHRVETVIQSPSRITLGGFMSFSHDHTKLFCWS